ncbi:MULTISPECIES: 5'/3'-nucleotidase SurE [Novosphingobium]|uniref:5'-nucleotidase SurE n=1 Tax=Novosphingobium decolorationis TaxID=2698673 RepID=A0ABX8E2R7_9SPHN|nr:MULTISPECIES: 5'/3'-nucleotidase SurE [Novosphingobium]MED5544587.1 5'/3'-nucleotidase SurE [Pseudomonadota bacterium]QVM83431.1 5'/3'-nucleotidase SurE [Novosphingobium decolorationis]GAM05696.1 5'-nucleotidase [Novosphingobium sp. MBES04]
MRILLTNDDGINAPGLYVLEKIAAQLSDDIWICAPSEEQSGAGHSLTLNRPVRLREHAPRRFSVTGTPTDSVTMALRKVLPGKPDLILSGVNRGANLGDDITYSGTVSAAMEGALAGIPAIAMSQLITRNDSGHDVSFSAAEEWGAKVLKPLVEAEFAPRTLLNVNFPALPGKDVKGVRVVRQGFHDYERGTLVESVDPRGFPYFWFGLQGIEHTIGANTDLEATSEGFVSVTPLQLDLTHEASLAALAQRFEA